MCKFAFLVNDESYKHYTVLEAEKNGCSVPCLKKGMETTLFRIHNAEPLNRIIELPFKSIWYSKCIDKTKINAEREIYFLLYESFHMSYSKKLIKYLRKHYPKGKIIFYFSNPVSEYNLNRVNRIRKLLDAVFTFNKADADRYGFTYFTMDPFKLPLYKIQEENASDVFFIGSDKGRLDLIIKVFEKLNSAGLKCDFWIVDVPKERQKYPDLIHYNERLSYEEVLQRDCNTKCILEILQEDKQYYSIKTAEALQYKKKLLTSNRNVINEWFYDSKIIQCFDDPEKIDIDFLVREIDEGLFRDLDIGSYERFAENVVKCMSNTETL